MKKRVIALLLSFLMLSFCAFSCTKSDGAVSNDDGQDIEDPTPEGDIFPPESENEDRSENEKDGLPRTAAFDNIPSVDYGGREFVILATEPQFADSVDGKGIVGAELYKRNRAIEEKFNIKIVCKSADQNSVKPALQGANEENPLPDLIYAPQDTISSCAGSGLLMNVYSLPYFDYKSEHCDPALLSSLSQSDTTYGVYGDAAYDERSAWCVFYNKDILSYLGFADPYALVENNTWTWDMFLAISEGALLDLDKNGRMQAAKDRYGYSSSMNTSSFANAVFASFGKKFFSVDEEGFLKMDFDISKEDDYISVIRNICVSHKAKYPASDPGALALDAFNEGRLAFFCEKLSLASTLAYSPVNWGILPMPKRWASDEGYKSWVDSSVCGYAVPQGAADSALSGRVLDAICAYEESYGTDIVDLSWTYYYLRDNDSVLAMRDAINGAVYDVAYAFGEGMADFSIVSYDLLQSVMEKNVKFSNLYDQSVKPFSAFVRQKFVH